MISNNKIFDKPEFKKLFAVIEKEVAVFQNGKAYTY